MKITAQKQVILGISFGFFLIYELLKFLYIKAMLKFLYRTAFEIYNQFTLFIFTVSQVVYITQLSKETVFYLFLWRLSIKNKFSMSYLVFYEKIL